MHSFDDTQCEEVYVCPFCGCSDASDPLCGHCTPLAEYDGQPTEYEEWQDVYGGDDYDFGQFDCFDDFGCGEAF